MGVDMGLFRDVAEGGAEGLEMSSRMSAPSKSTWPSLGSSMPVMILTVVDLPEPLGPR